MCRYVHITNSKASVILLVYMYSTFIVMHIIYMRMYVCDINFLLAIHMHRYMYVYMYFHEYVVDEVYMHAVHNGSYH